MPTAQGEIYTNPSAPDRLMAQFEIDGQLYQYHGTINPGVPQFRSKTAYVTYAQQDDLTGRHPVAGSINRDHLSMQLLDNDRVRIEGDLVGDIDNARFNGEGMWLRQ